MASRDGCVLVSAVGWSFHSPRLLLGTVLLFAVCLQVGEEDHLLGLWQRRASVEATKVALSLVQHSSWERAEELLGELNRQAVQGGVVVSDGREAWT